MFIYTNLVYEVARRHKLDDEGDIVLLWFVMDLDVMDKFGVCLVVLVAVKGTESKLGKLGILKLDFL